jgi:hypothetical protein
MTDPVESPESELELLRARTRALESQLLEAEETTRARLMRAELKAHAVQAGMIDLDGLKLIDTDELRLSSSGEVEGAAALMISLRRKKPWLFGDVSSSSAATPPSSAPLKKKLATEMTTEEWRAARTDILRHR